MKKSSAVITVFFSLLSTVFLGLSFAFLEGIRYRSARAHCADLTAAGNWSVFSGFENRLLEQFDLFAIDGGSGDGRFSPDSLSSSLKSYLDENAQVSGTISEKLPGLSFDPFQVSAQTARISEYALLSDKNGEYYYQQAVDFMHETGWMNAIGKLSDEARGAKEAQDAIDDYKEAKKQADRQIGRIRTQTSQAGSDAGSSSGHSGEPAVQITGSDSAPASDPAREAAAKVKNPLWKMLTLGFRSVLPLVCGSRSVSEKKISGNSLLSKRGKQSGTLKLDTKRGGITDNLLFREYLLDHFQDYSAGSTDACLDYQIEYILCGCSSDRKNLKKTVKKLLHLREACNYLYLQQDAGSIQKTQSLATLILGWSGNAALIESLRELLLVYWAYGESLYDVRILIHGGRVSLTKTASDWHVPLDRLYDIEHLLRGADHTSGRGSSYSDYLRLLLDMQGISPQKKRSLDLLELVMRSAEGFDSFRADHCVIAVKDTCEWKIRPVFSRVSDAFLNTRFPGGRIRIESGFAY